FHRRPAVRGIAVKQQLGASDDILQQMQNELQPTATPSTTSQMPVHACQRTNNTSNYSWPYYSEANLNSRPTSRSSGIAKWSKGDYVSRQSSAPVSQHSDACYAHAQSMASYHYQRQQENMYRNCSLYANVGCSDSSQELYSSQTSSEQTSPVRSARCRRPESPPPIRSHHQLLYVPYSNNYHYQQDYTPQNWTANESPMYQPAPGSPSRAGRGAPEGAPTATSPMTAPQNPVYYAMNV
ncbi:jg19111, partial [Pararge aegeria aegeria]